MNCIHCGGKLVPWNLLANQPEKRRHYADAKLDGFSDPNGFRCENVKTCVAIYCTAPSGAIELLHPEVRYEPLKDGDPDDIWEIVDVWIMFIDTADYKRIVKELEDDHKHLNPLDDNIWDCWQGGFDDRPWE